MAAIKLDENLGSGLLQRARQAGHDAESVRSQRLNGTSDASLFEHCKSDAHSDAAALASDIFMLRL